MPSLLSGSLLNSSSPTGYAKLQQAQYQLGPTPTTSTGYTLIANSGSQVTFVSSLGNLQFFQGSVYSNVPDRNINVIGTGTGTVVVSGAVANTSTFTGVLLVEGGIGIRDGFYTGKDVYVNGIQIGQGSGSVNNIVLTGNAQYSGGRPDGENSIVIGYNALQGLSQAENSIAIGRFALQSGTQIINTIALGDGALQNSGTRPLLPVGNITTISLGTQTIVTVPGHNLSTGSEVIITNVQGPTQLNGNVYVVSYISTNTFQLYPNGDFGLLFPLNSTGFPAYITSGTVIQETLSINNIGIGTQVAPNFYNGQQNFFMGYNAAPKFTTGSYNLFIGNQVSQNMRSGNNNVSIYGRTLQDATDNQIAIGAVFYYNGTGYTQINSDLGVGLGDESTSTVTGSFQVSGGAGLTGSLFVGGNLVANGFGSVILAPTTGTVTVNPGSTGTMDNIVIGSSIPQRATFTTATIVAAVPASSTSTGALQVPNGGISTHGSIYSQDGNSQQNYLLYTPRISVQATAPSSPRIGDFWANLNTLRYYQYINDGSGSFWIQIAQL